jgi:Secretion system C-terminal sorting domain
MSALKYFTCIVLLTLTTRIYSQIPDTIWTKTFGGLLADIGNSVKQTNDGGFIVAGTTSSFGSGGQDIYLIKTDENGDTLWTKTFGGPGNDRATSVVQTNDNGYAIFGSTNSFGNGGDDFLLWKTDSFGNTKWFKTYGGITDERAYEGHQLEDGTYIIAGDSIGQNNNAWLVKTDIVGNYIWGITVGSSSYEIHFHGRSVQQISDGGFALCGIRAYLVYPGSYVNQFFYSKISPDGIFIYNRYYGTYVAVWGTVVNKLYDGNLILAGTIRIDGSTPEKPLIIKMDQFGNIIWWQIVLGSYYPAFLTSIEPTSDNGSIITVRATDLPDIILLKCDENGILIWEKIVGGPQDDRANSICLTSESGYIVTGYTKSFGAGNSDIWLLKFKYNPPPEITVITPNGGEHWMMWDTVKVEWTATGIDSVKIELSLSEGIDWMTIAESVPNTGTFDWFVQAPFTSWYCLMKISDVSDSTIFDISDTTFTIDIFPAVEDSSGLFPNGFVLLQNFPNPFNPSTKIIYAIPPVTLRQAQSDIIVTLKVYDVLGNEIATLVNEEKQPGTYEVEFNTSSIKHLPSSGIYFYQLRAGDYIETKKMVLIK